MADLRERVCWKASTAIATLSTEAVSPSTSVFLATHVPLRISRRDPQLRADVGGIAVTEEDVLDDFLNRPLGNGVLLMPVIGQSGTGKSHLVRWVYERTRRRSADNLVVIHVPKASTSLRALVRILLDREDIVSEKLTQLRRQVDDLASGMDEQALQRHLLFALAEAVAAADPGTDKSRRALVGPTRLAMVLRDVHVGSYLTQDGALIPRLAASLLHDRGEGESDRPTQFTPEDLPHIADIDAAASNVRSLLALMMDRPRLQMAAAALITENLSTAVQQVFKLGGRLQDAMLTIREEYHKQGKEIVLLIEDFAVIQGLQRDLLEALIEAGVRDGRQVLAPVRTLMAVTTGYYRNLAETVVTRVEAATPYVYDLDAAFDPDSDGPDYTMDFIGRYLNAARLGAENLEAAGVADNAPVPNACENDPRRGVGGGECRFRTSCHEAFGASESGYGLFPFNWPALRRAIKSTAGEDETFNPRRIIGRVIRPVLEDAESLANGQFPSSRFREQFPLARDELALSPEVKVNIADLDPVDNERRALLLEFWGDAPPELRNLEPGIHEAFAISTLSTASTAPTTPPPGRRATDASSTATPGRTTLQVSQQAPADLRDKWSRSLRTMVEDVAEWEAGRRPLLQNTAAAVRRIISTAVVNRCDWSTPLMAEPSADAKRAAWPAKSSVVSIQDAEAEAQNAGAPIRFTRNARNAMFFRHLLTLDQGAEDPGNAAALPRLARLADRYQGDLIRAVQRVRSADDEHLTAGLTASLVGASLAGRAWPGMSDAELMAVAFDDGASWSLADAALRTARWVDAYEKHRIHRRALVAELRQLLGVAQGSSGAVRILDSGRALSLVRKAAAHWAWEPGTAAAPWYKDAASSLRHFETLVKSQLAMLQEHRRQLAEWLPIGVSVGETLDAVDQAFQEATKVGLLPGGEMRQTFPAQLTVMRTRDWRIVEQLRRDLERVESAEDAQWRRACITAASRDRGADLGALMEFLRSGDDWLTAGLQAAHMRTGGLGEDLAEQVRQVRTEWEQIVANPHPGEESHE
ncbi:protein DpdH [Micromonospora sp. WMMD1128]|uniref:protein DpdH n=1 Tax=Micromonospora sp. WMMD1128 TaxID=3015150 RepID=UPI00248AF492|nr:protein DpdH [Micromonospora sp. WMMD1128]WBB72598.1 protein DpdH [Micromonospora sp. WMMD1128]